MSETRGPVVHRPAASATWDYQHRWGTSLGDITRLSVTRTDGGSMRIAYGKESLDIREELVERLAEMIAAAAAWTDRPATQPADLRAGANEGEGA